MDIGVIGAGRMGQLHIKNLLAHDDIQNIYVFDPYVDEKFLDDKSITVVDNISDLMQSPLHAIMITSPSHLHTDQIRLAASFGKHIFCEKPLGLELTDIEDAIDHCAKANVILQIGFNRRFDTHFHELKNRINDVVGVPHVIKITSRDPECPSRSYLKTSGGIFFDMCIHDLDMARYMAGSEVIEVYSQGSCLIDASLSLLGEIDTAVIQLKFANNAMAVIDNSRRAVYGYDQRIEVYSNKGTLKADNVLSNQVTLFNDKGIKHARLRNFFSDRYAYSYQKQLAAFIHSVKHGLPAEVTGFDGLQAVRLAFAAARSYEEKNRIRLNDKSKKKTNRLKRKKKPERTHV